MNVKRLSTSLRVIIVALIILGAVITLVTLLALFIPDRFDGTTIGIPVPFESNIQGDFLSPGRTVGAIVQGGTAHVALDLSCKPILIGSWLFMAAAIGAALWITGQIKLIFDAAATGKPFADETIGRIRRIALGVFVIGVFRILLSIALYLAAEAWLRIPGISPALRLDDLIGFIAVGAIFLGFAEIFRYGLSLQREQDLTI